MGNLGIVLGKLGQYEKARKCYQQNIKVFIRHYGANHAETKRVKRNLAILEEHVPSKSNQKQPKSPLDNLLNEEDEEKVDSEKDQKQPKVPKIDKAKKHKAALIRETCHFVEAMKGQLAKTSVPAYLGSAQWDANAAPTFVAAVLRMYRKQQYPHALSQAENHGIPTALVPFIKVYIDRHPQLKQVVQRPEFCKSHLEKPLMLGQINQLRDQLQPNENKEVFDID